MTSKAWKAVLVFVPLAILAALPLLHAWNRAHGEQWRVPIAGYDPRDPLRGQYLQFRYEWNLAGDAGRARCIGAECALCTEDPTAFNPSVTLVTLDYAERSCPHFIAGAVRFEPGNFQIGKGNSGLTRYFIPEDEARSLETLLRATNEADAPAFAMGLRVTPRGQAYIDRLYVDDVPLEQWLRAR